MIVRRKKELDGSIYFQIEANEGEFEVLEDAMNEYFNSVSIETNRRLDVATVMNEFLKVKQERGM
jgi:hypothetical protein